MKKLTERSITEHATALRERQYSAAELLCEYLREIKEHDGEIGAYLTVDEEGANAAADRADRMLARGNAPVLCGIPCAVKDNIMTCGVRTTCGSRLLENYVPPYSATVVKLLCDSGAVILGKTNLDEFAMGSSMETSPFKKTVNPCDKSRVPGGSSGGSAAAVASGEAAFALGSDTGGSIRQPAAFCGTVGIKPTYGAVSRYGLCAMTSSFDQIGPITRTVRDNAAVLSAICKYDRNDSTSVNRTWEDFTELFGDDLKGVKIAVVKELTEGAAPQTYRCLDSAKKALSDLGCTFYEISLPSLAYAYETYSIICSAEVSSNMGRFDGIRYGNCDGSLPYDVLRSEKLGAEVKKRMLFGAFVLSKENYEKYYMQALRAKEWIRRELSEAFCSCDAILSPTASDVAFRWGNAPLTDGTYRGDRYCMPANIAGLPSLSVPCGVGEGGLPVGMLLTGAPFSEAVLYRIAHAFERYRDE